MPRRAAPAPRRRRRSRRRARPVSYTFLKTCFGMEIGKSLFDKKGAELAPGLLAKAKAKGCNIVFPCN